MIGSVECYAGFLYFMYICISGDIPPCLRIMQHPVNPCHFKLSQGTHTHTNTQADVQIKHGHVRQRTHTNAQDFRTSWQSWGPKTQSYPMAQAQTPREWDVKARGEFYVVDDMQQHVGDARTHTHTYTFKNMLLGTPCRLGWTESFAAILFACTPLISTVSAYLQHTHTHAHTVYMYLPHTRCIPVMCVFAVNLISWLTERMQCYYEGHTHAQTYVHTYIYVCEERISCTSELNLSKIGI